MSVILGSGCHGAHCRVHQHIARVLFGFIAVLAEQYRAAEQHDESQQRDSRASFQAPLTRVAIRRRARTATTTATAVRSRACRHEKRDGTWRTNRIAERRIGTLGFCP
ncbi:hypothetical protein AAHK20_14175 [Trinickia sp. YCB016]